MITGSQLLALLPIIVLAASATVVMLVIAFRRDHRLTFWLTVAALLTTLLLTVIVSSETPIEVTALLTLDRYALFFTGLSCVAGVVVATLSRDYLCIRQNQVEEFYLLLLTTILGAAVLAASNHFAAFFLGLETLSVSLFPLIAYSRDDKRALEAAMKYLVLSGIASGFLLFGMALIYTETGVLEFSAMEMPAITASSVAGMGLIVVALGFKLSLAPFHLWTADVYQGAPAPVTALLATVSKAAMLAVLLRYGIAGGLLSQPAFLNSLGVLAAASILIGNLAALKQDNLKRLLGYSSIAHMGYLMVALMATPNLGTALAAETLTVYLVAYVVTVLAALGVITVLSPNDREAEGIEEYAGLFWTHPWPAAILTVALLSLAGIPLTAGFIGKFYIFAAGGQASLWLLLGVVIVGSGLGLYYYLRIVFQMTRPAPSEHPAIPVADTALGSRLALGLLGLAVLALGILPSKLIELLEALGESFRQY